MDYTIMADYDTAYCLPRLEDLQLTPELAIAPPPPTCEQCASWRPALQIITPFGLQHRPGYCEARAAAGLFRMPPSHAQHCRLFVEDVPF